MIKTLDAYVNWAKTNINLYVIKDEKQITRKFEDFWIDRFEFEQKLN